MHGLFSTEIHRQVLKFCCKRPLKNKPNINYNPPRKATTRKTHWQLKPYTCTFFLTFESSKDSLAEIFFNLVSEFLNKPVISRVRPSITRSSSFPSPNVGIKAFACALTNSPILVRILWIFTDISSESSTHAGGRPIVNASPLHQKQNFIENNQIIRKRWESYLEVEGPGSSVLSGV